MIANDEELKVTVERTPRFQEQVAHLRRVETNPQKIRAWAAGFLEEIDRMQEDVPALRQTSPTTPQPLPRLPCGSCGERVVAPRVALGDRRGLGQALVQAPGGRLPVVGPLEVGIDVGGNGHQPGPGPATRGGGMVRQGRNPRR